MTLLAGVVIKSTGSWYQVKSERQIYDCRIIGKFRLGKLKVTNPVAVGDIVRFELEEEKGKGIIKEIDNRKNYVVRQSPRKKHFVHLLASNVDQAILVITIKEPMLKQGFIDRFLMMTEPYSVPVTIVFNKWDLYEQEDIEMYNYLKAVYESIGYTVIKTSTIEEGGIENLKLALKGKQSLIAGQSGVGKSTIVNLLIENANLKTQELSNHSGKGQHTTTFAEMFFIDEQTSIIDTPGIKTLSFNFLEEQDIIHNFREIFALSSECKFGDCTHRNEPKCAVKEALEKGEISDLRYSSYLQLLKDTEDQNYWERHKDI